jgi:hypothetical protein
MMRFDNFEVCTNHNCNFEGLLRVDLEKIKYALAKSVGVQHA